jgi:hypothetical protein
MSKYSGLSVAQLESFISQYSGNAAFESHVSDCMAELLSRQGGSTAVAEPKAEKPKRATKQSKPKAAAPKTEAKPSKAVKAKRERKPFGVSTRQHYFTANGGLKSHCGMYALYRPEGSKAEQKAWFDAQGLGCEYYYNLVDDASLEGKWLCR